MRIIDKYLVIWNAETNEIITSQYIDDADLATGEYFEIFDTEEEMHTILDTQLRFKDIDSYLNYLFINRERFATKANTINTAQTPSGIFQAPSGYVQATLGLNGNDGLPVSSGEKIYVLVNQNIDQTNTKKYKWTITTN